MRASVRDAVAGALGARVTDTRPVSGGDINEAYRVRLTDGRTVFVKTNAGAHPRMFQCEARGLAWLAEADCVRVPEVLAVSAPDAEEPTTGPHFLILEFLAPGRRARNYDESLGRGLAELHLAGADSFGLDHDNFIATLEQTNRAFASWSDFYGSCRLVPLAERAVTHGLAPQSWRQRFAKLAQCMATSELCGPPEPPARLHGDLWSGNVHTDDSGHPCLIDPAVYGGHREIDLAMLALFGGLDERVLDAYHERYPLATGWRERVPLYQLYPLLVHVNLFGSGYVASVERALARYL